jgi:16S rRNA (adenine1518-N6/adenine1519-N6)-dimethyltransferase
MPLAAEPRLIGAEAARCLGHGKRDRPDAALRRDDKQREPASRGSDAHMNDVRSNTGPRPKKRFGQHFLISRTILDGILRLAELTPEDVVVEIGAGTGTLTEAIASRVGRLLALEVDRDLIPPLSQRFAARPHVEIIHADALTFDFAQLPAPVKVVANLPYGTAVAILTRVLEQRYRVRCAVIMLQREVAERLYAQPGTKAYGSLTLLTQWYATVEKGFNVPPSAFSPPPKVMSTVVRIIPRSTLPVAVQDETWLFRIIHAAFAQRRKMLANALRHEFQATEPSLLHQALETSGIAGIRRGETLTIDEFARLSAALQRILAG